jgi:putative nucleotidyltransferase with HDIG domain
MADNYFPIPLKRIVVDSIPDFDLYIKQKEVYVLYRKANILFGRDTLSNLITNNVVSLFVSKKDIKLYEGYRERMRVEHTATAREQGYDGRFVNPDEVSRYHDIRDSFHVVECSIFEKGMVIDIPIYYHENNDVHLCEDFQGKPEGPWELTDKFFSSDGTRMVRNEDLPKYKEIVRKLLNSFKEVWVGEERIRIEREALALREMSKMVIKDILDDPRSGEKIKQLDDTVDNLVNFILDNETSFYSLMRITTHDYYTYVHSLNVCTFSVGLGSVMGLRKKTDLERLGLGAMLHDVGKSQVDSQLINKPGKLTDEEFCQMKNHVKLGLDILKTYHNLPDPVLEPVAQHHEKMTGTGYPLGLMGKDITLFGRISAIVDIYDALTTERSYKRALTPFEALSFLNKTEKDYDKNCLRQFILTLGKQIRE